MQRRKAFLAMILGGFPLIAEITHCHTFIKEINHASACIQYFNENFYCKNCLRVFSAMTGKPALERHNFTVVSNKLTLKPTHFGLSSKLGGNSERSLVYYLFNLLHPNGCEGPCQYYFLA